MLASSWNFPMFFLYRILLLPNQLETWRFTALLPFKPFHYPLRWRLSSKNNVGFKPKKTNQNPLEQHKCSLFSFSTDNWNLLLATGDNPAELRCVYMVWNPLSRSSVTKPLLFPSQLSLMLSVCRFSPFFLAFLHAFTWLRTVFHPSAPGSWSIASSSPWLACFCAPKAQFAHMAFPRRIQG